uniref:G-protein coupled receptors family 1 profile domain-containing protein n=1 Tax=Periophthalmus magnuspinnatus TaxID=409849 RepID=A0A3B4AX75_9GOBI
MEPVNVTLALDTVGDLKERFTASVTPDNATLSEDLLQFSSNTNETTAVERDPKSLILAVCITALYSAICVVGLLGNVLVMYGVVRYTKMKTATNIYIFNLALADALATSTLPFQSAKYLMETWPFGELLCKTVMAIDYYNMFTSIFTLTMMSVDRYIAVCHPVKALDFRTPAKAKIINVCIWILSSAVGVPVTIMAVTKVTRNIACMMQFPEPDWYWDTVTKICVMVLVVVAAFVICWTPIHIFIIVRTIVHVNQNNLLVKASWHLCIALGYTNSSLNPVLYAFLDENFKRCLRDFCFPSRSHMEQSSFSRVRNSTREPASICAPSRRERAPA